MSDAAPDKEPLRERIERERKQRTDALRQKQEAAKKIREDLDSFAKSFSSARPLKQPDTNNDTPVITRHVTQTNDTKAAEPTNTPTPKKDKGIPLEFYCFVDGRLGLVNLYAQSDPFII